MPPDAIDRPQYVTPDVSLVGPDAARRTLRLALAPGHAMPYMASATSKSELMIPCIAKLRASVQSTFVNTIARPGRGEQHGGEHAGPPTLQPHECP